MHTRSTNEAAPLWSAIELMLVVVSFVLAAPILIVVAVAGLIRPKERIERDTSSSYSEQPFDRWLILTQYYEPEPGAPQIRLAALTRELKQRGCLVEVLTAVANYPHGVIAPSHRGRLRIHEHRNGAAVERLALYPAAGTKPFARLVCYLTFTAAAMTRILAYRPDVVFVEAQPVTLAFAGLLMKWVRGIPYIYNTPDLQVEIAGDERWIGLKVVVRAAASLESFLMKQAFCVSTVTEAFVDHFAESRKIDRGRISFLPNGADTRRLRPLPPDIAYAEALGVAGKTVFTYAGTHAPYHGLEILLDVAEQLRDREDIVLLMVGQGPIRPALEKAAAERQLPNLLFRDSPFSDMPRLMSISRASLVTLSDTPAAAKMRLSKVIPPLACGRPVLYLGRGESADMLLKYDCGVVLSPGDVQGFADAIRHVADDEDRCRHMGENGRQLAVDEFSWTLLVSRWFDQLERIKHGKDAAPFAARRLVSQRSGAVSALLPAEPVSEGPGIETIFPRLIAVLGLIATSPILAVCAAAVYLNDRGPVLFRQVRIGRHGRTFTMLKLRSMRVHSSGGAITASGDDRITAVGRFLRRYKLDEFPQLWNVALGEMSFVGPRPEVPGYVDLADERWQEVLSVRPGITDLATLIYRDEELLLGSCDDPEVLYRRSVLPRKLALSAWYVRRRSVSSDARLVALTVLHSFLPVRLDPKAVAARFSYRGAL